MSKIVYIKGNIKGIDGTEFRGWYHLSTRASTYLLRNYKDGLTDGSYIDPSVYNVAMKEGKIDEMTMSEVGLLLPGYPALDSVTYDEVSIWTNVLHYLDLDYPDGRPEEKVESTTNTRIIPITDLRVLYRFSRNFSAPAVFVGKIASAFLPDSDVLIKKLKISIKQFSTYDNRDEPFHPPRPNQWSVEGNPFAKKLTAYLGNNKNVQYDVLNTGKQEVSAIDYEVSPYRTTKSVFADGRSGKSSGQGGMDLLMAINDGSNQRVPLIGEIKALTDTTAFLALIQALTYAVELCSVAQRERLHTSYKCYELCKDKPLQIVIIVQNGKIDDTLTPSKEIAEKITADEEIQKYIGEIHFVSCEFGADNTPNFKEI